MQPSILPLGCALIIGGAALAIADYSHTLPEQSRSIRLGRFYLLNDFLSVEDARSRIEKIGLQGAAKVFNAALERDAGSALRWCDAGEALADAGDEERAAYCYRRAEELAPRDPSVLLAVGDYYARTGNPKLAIVPFSRILRDTGAPPVDILTSNVFAYYERMHVRESGLLDAAIPDAVNARAYLRFLMPDAGPAAVRALWQWTHQKGFDDDRLTADCAGYLYRVRQFDAAQEGWLRRFGNRGDGYPRANLIFNGGFEHETTGAVLDWTFDGFDKVKITRDPHFPDEGQFSLRADFSGNDNPDFHHLKQVVLLRPGRYRFEAHMRTQAITSNEGVRFRITALGDRTTLLAETAALSGDNGWMPLAADFTVAPGIRAIEVALARRRSIRIDNQLTGSVWIDSVKLDSIKLTPAAHSPAEPARSQ